MWKDGSCVIGVLLSMPALEMVHWPDSCVKLTVTYLYRLISRRHYIKPRRTRNAARRPGRFLSRGSVVSQQSQLSVIFLLSVRKV